jgi:GNAT superfamily N-acetyltransferase
MIKLNKKRIVMYEEIYIEEAGGEITGYSVNFKSENYEFFLADCISNKNTLDKIIGFIKKEEFNNITIIKNLNVEEEFRGQGIGKALLENAVSDGNIVLLISDKYESQLKDFLLDKFYEQADFLKITDTSSGSLMCYPSEVASNLLAYINKPEIKSKIKRI